MDWLRSCIDRQRVRNRNDMAADWGLRNIPIL